MMEVIFSAALVKKKARDAETELRRSPSLLITGGLRGVREINLDNHSRL
jgi:hypothetical protein